MRQNIFDRYRTFSRSGSYQWMSEQGSNADARKSSVTDRMSWFGASLMLSLGRFAKLSTTAMPSPTSERAVVHVVDDDASMRSALEGLFESVGLETRTYAAAGEFLAARLIDKPGCIVIDVRLPDINGLDFHAQLI